MFMSVLKAVAAALFFVACIASAAIVLYGLGG